MGKLWVMAGHGAGDPGAGGGGQNEAENVRRLAKRIKELGGDSVVLMDMNRNWYADGGVNGLNVPKGDWLVELHRDSDASSARGAHVIIKGGIGGADRYDKALAASLSAIFPGRANTIVERTDLANANRAYKRGINYRLVEIGFISNADDRRIFDTRLDDIARAILSAFGISSGGGSVRGAGWYKDSHGWWYENGDGTYKRNCWWMPERGVWYYFGNDGYALTGWSVVDGKWYYFAKAGEPGLKECQMVAGAWRKDSKGLDYWLSGDGSMATSRWVDKARYYVKADGSWDKAR